MAIGLYGDYPGGQIGDNRKHYFGDGARCRRDHGRNYGKRECRSDPSFNFRACSNIDIQYRVGVRICDRDASRGVIRNRNGLIYNHYEIECGGLYFYEEENQGMSVNHNIVERIVKICLWIFTIFTISILFYIIGFVLKNGIGGLSKEFFLEFPKSMGREGGIFPIIVGTILLTIVAVFIAGPLGIGTAVYLTEYTRENRMTQIIRFGADCLAGIPSIVFGLFGFVLFVIKFKMGWSIISGSLTLSIMILPTIIRTSEEAIRAVPGSLREVSYSLGGTRWQTIVSVVIPQAIPGILTGIILSIGRCVGETAAVIFTAGSSLRLPGSVFDSVRTMSVHFYILSREGISLKNAYATASVLIISIGLINFLSYWIMRRFIRRIEGK